MRPLLSSYLSSFPRTSPVFNLTPRIISLVDRDLLHGDQQHPLATIKTKITNSLGTKYKVMLGVALSTIVSNLSPIVNLEQNFDSLNIKPDHCSRDPSNTYYLNEATLLRTHTSAHQLELLKTGTPQFVVFGDVYRRDEIDRYHYPVFHQMEAVKILGDKSRHTVDEAVTSLKGTVQKIVSQLFGDCQKRWIDAYFPFTEPSFQLEIFYDGKWVQMLGCGVIHQAVMDRCGRGNEIGWAAGLGLQRLAMKLFKIPDVRLFWSNDNRFLSQFKAGVITEFKPFSKYPACFKDFSIWVSEKYNSNDLFEIVREVSGDLVEDVQEVDSFQHPKTGRKSVTYRVSFRSLERTLKNEEIVQMQFKIRDNIAGKLQGIVELR